MYVDLKESNKVYKESCYFRHIETICKIVSGLK